MTRPVGPVAPRPVGPAAARWSGAVTFVVCTVAAGALFWLGTGLRPWPWATWLMPVPLYVLGATAGWRRALLAGFLAGVAGAGNLAGYALHSLELPVVPVVAYIGVQGLSLGVVAVLHAVLTRRGRHVLGVVVPAAAWVTCSWLLSLATPDGAFLALGYSQAALRPVLSVASLAGVWGVDFLVLAAPALVVTAARSPDRLRWVASGGLAATAVLGYGLWFDRTAAGADPVTVAAIALAQPYDPVDIASPDGRLLLRSYQAAIRHAVGRGARLVVLPEKAFAITPRTRHQLLSGIRAAAVGDGTTVVAGALLTEPGRPAYNIALAVTGAGAVTYRKQHLVPGLEGDLTAGDTTAFTGRTWGLAICKDLDFPQPARRYVREGAGLLAVPAWDFTVDGWLHSRMAMTRGVESGTAVVRAARDGQLTVSDATGRLLSGTASASSGGERLAVASVPTAARQTPFARWGYWFEWTCALVVALTAARLARRPVGGIDRLRG